MANQGESRKVMTPLGEIGVGILQYRIFTVRRLTRHFFLIVVG